jgi:anti-sigma B factor antagonist
MALQVKIADEKDMVILALEGRIDSSSIEDLNHGLDEVKRRGKKNIILMFRDLEYINSQGMSALLSFLKWVEEEEGDVKIAEVQPEIMGILKILGFDTLIRVFDSLSDAMKSFRKDGVRELEGKMENENEMVVDEDFQRAIRPEGSKMPLLLIAGGVFLFLILLIVYLTRDNAPDLQPLQKKVALLEQRIARLEVQNKDLSDIPGKIEALRKDLTERSQLLEKEVTKVRLEMQSASQKVTPSSPPQAKPAPKQPQYHTVVRGETLFGIGRKYHVSVEELRRLNDLKPSQPITVGQKLIVGSS